MKKLAWVTLAAVMPALCWAQQQSSATIEGHNLDVGRVPLTMTEAEVSSTECKITLTKVAALAAKIEVTWDGSVASATFHLDRGPNDSEW